MHVKHDCWFKEGKNRTWGRRRKWSWRESLLSLPRWNCINLEHSNGQISRAENTYTSVEYKYYMKQPATYEHLNPPALISICSEQRYQTLLLRQINLRPKEGVLLILFQSLRSRLQLRRKRFGFWDTIRHETTSAVTACLCVSSTGVWCADESNLLFVYLNIIHRQTTWLLLQWILSREWKEKSEKFSLP